MGKFITHIQRLKEKAPILEFQDLIAEGLGNKLKHFLFQMPPSFHFSEKNLEKIIEHVPNVSQNVIELRHISR